MKKRKILLFLTFIISIVLLTSFSSNNLKIAKLKYNGGGDWYANKTSLTNLITFTNKNLNTLLAPKEDIVEVGSTNLFDYPFVHLTGHGNITLSINEAQNLRNYLTSGGFLHIDDNYGLDQYIRIEMKKVFPELDFVELPFSHKIYHQKYNFDNGLPKIHEHDGKAPKGFGLIHNNKLVCFYSYECDLGNGWEDQSVHNDPESIRQKALQMGANIISYSFSN